MRSARAVVGGPLYGAIRWCSRGGPPQPVERGRCASAASTVLRGRPQAGRTAPHARAAGVRLAVEPLNRFETDVLNTTRQGVALMKLVGDPAVGLVLDTFHMNMEDDDIPDAIRAAAGHLIHFQANENHRGYLGTGHIDWTATVRALADIGYEGTVSLEPFRRNDERIGIPFAQWKPPGRDEQAELTASCALMRGLLRLNGTRR
jgi:D-psicose/D-tagatose/L-ribulose 3-epimerase